MRVRSGEKGEIGKLIDQKGAFLVPSVAARRRLLVGAGERN